VENNGDPLRQLGMHGADIYDNRFLQLWAKTCSQPSMMSNILLDAAIAVINNILYKHGAEEGKEMSTTTFHDRIQ